MTQRSQSPWLGVLAMLAVFALLELAAWVPFRLGLFTRTARPVVEYPYHPYLGWEHRTDHTYRGVLAGGLYSWSIRTDSLGTTPTPRVSEPEPEVRVVVVGGSAIFGVGQSDNAHNVPSQVEAELARRTGKRVEVTNLAVGGYTSFQEMLVTERWLSRHPADLIVSISGYNDAFAAAIEHGADFGLLLHRLDPKTELMRSIESGGLRVLPVAANIAVQALRRRSNAVDLLGKIADKLAPQREEMPWVGTTLPDSVEIVRRARFVTSNYAMMDGLARQHGARFVMLLQPTAMSRERLTPAEHAALDSLKKGFLSHALPVVRVFYPAMAAAPKTYEFHDLADCLDDFAAPAYADECHFLDAATPTVAAAVCDVIAPLVANAGSPPATAGARAPVSPRR